MPPGVARIVYVGHSTVLVDLDGVRLLTDPVLRPRLLHLRRTVKVDAGVLRGVDAVLISHAHFDHLDLPSLDRLGRNIPIVAPRGALSLLKRKGFTSVSELAVGEELQIGSLVVRGVEALHAPERMPFGLRAEPMGHLIEGSRSVYFAGDTDLIDEMAALAPVDVALVPIWGWGPSLGTGHMNPRSAAEAVRLLRATVAVPIHWGTYFPLQTGLRGTPAFLDEPAAQFESHVREIAPEVEVRILRPGDETAV